MTNKSENTDEAAVLAEDVTIGETVAVVQVIVESACAHDGERAEVIDPDAPPTVMRAGYGRAGIDFVGGDDNEKVG